jgi:hypothetical protein
MDDQQQRDAERGRAQRRCRFEADAAVRGRCDADIAVDEKENAPYLASPRDALGQNAAGR